MRIRTGIEIECAFNSCLIVPCSNDVFTMFLLFINMFRLNVIEFYGGDVRYYLLIYAP